ncbi:hypothetical protein PMI07_005569 [Rhizobium sp. CF080]|uniref:tripartite tricarboxylate transporter TctB family protein n=1 Tax=Rhizobium sp. (strain CF080) TaxID=1144310 RepID=UPI00027188C0|nr:tripartite tricarboxylate transporter TctB family protein [Rhizobium sp. CF080]EUB99288.1 hypothetical protein PMI07_005569 [Rhizobium sp. CF080]
MKARDYAANLFLLGFALLIMKASYGLGLGTMRVPGMGFTAFWAAFIMAVLSVVHFVVIYTKADEVIGAALLGRALVTKILPAFAVLFAATWLMSSIGFVTTICLLMTALIIIVRQKVTWSALPVAVVTAVACHLLFQTLLSGQFPRGAFGF